MKSKITIGIIVLVAAGFLGGQSRIPPRVNTAEMMRFKLYDAQGILEGIATENYPLIETNATKLIAMSQTVDWRVRDTPEYQRFTADFTRHARTLQTAARDKNVDAATVAYFQMTVSCVQCHKYLRGVHEAKLDFEISGKTPAVGK